MERTSRIHLKVSEDDDDGEVVAYLTLPDHRDSSPTVCKNVRLRDLVGDYTGPDLFFDFDHENILVGVEIID